jgi:hypothetical protein
MRRIVISKLAVYKVTRFLRQGIPIMSSRGRHFIYGKVEVYRDCDKAAKEDELYKESADDEIRASFEGRLCAYSLDAAA